MTTTLEEGFREFAEKSRHKKPDQSACEKQRDDLIKLQSTCHGFVNLFVFTLQRWGIKIEEPSAYRDLKAAAEKTLTGDDETCAIESLAWKDRNFAEHVVKRYKCTTENKRRNPGVKGRYIKELVKCSTLMDEDEFRRRANRTMFLRHKNSFPERDFSKSLGYRFSSFLLLTEVITIVNLAKDEGARSTGASSYPEDVLDEMSAWIERGVVMSNLGVQSLRDVEPDAYRNWMLCWDEHGFTSADANPERALFMTPASIVQSPAGGDRESTPLSSVPPSVPDAVPKRPESSQSSASSLSGESLSGFTVVASEPPGKHWDDNMEIFWPLPQHSLPQPDTVDISLSDSSSATEVEPSTAMHGVAEPDRASDTAIGAHERAEVAATLCGRLARTGTEDIVNGILQEWTKEASAPGASQSCMQRSECISGAWATWAPPAWTGAPTTDFDVTQCTPAEMLALARGRGELAKPVIIRQPANGQVAGQRLCCVEPSNLHQLELLGGVPGTIAPPLVFDFAQAPDWPLAASSEARFALLEDLFQVLTAVGHFRERYHPGRGCSPFSYVSGGHRGGFKPPTRYEWCGVWMRLTYGNAILSVQSEQQHWKNIYLQSGWTVYIPSGLPYAMTFLTFCVFCECVTWDSIALFQELKDMAAMPRLPVDLPNHVRSYIPHLIQALARPEGRQCLVNRAGISDPSLASTLDLLSGSSLNIDHVET